MEYIVTNEKIEAYCAVLIAEERAAATITKYRRDLKNLSDWLAGRPATKERLSEWTGTHYGNFVRDRHSHQ